jgi:hydroxyacylglutathione hydrolase
MIVKRFYDDKLAQASYLIGCAMHEEAVVIDANRDVDQYIRAAEQEGVRITHVTETHIHADYVSGSRELAYRTGAQLYLSDEGDENWKYQFARESGATLLKHGDSFNIGNVKIEAVHTPGHTPEHLSFLVTDGASADRPIGIVTGDFVFVGDVGRPDLLERAAGVEGTMVAGARTLFQSLKRFKELPDYIQIWPGHGAGSACGKGLSAIPTSTVGYERLFNWGLALEDEDAFVTAVLEGQPEPPRYFAEMKRINKEGPRILGGFRRPQRLPENRIDQVLENREVVVDTRPASDYAAGYIPGSINIPLDRSFNTWAGWLLPYDAEIYLIVNDRCTHCVDEAVRDLAMIGLDRIAGYFSTDVVESWQAHHGKIETVPQISVEELNRILPEATVVDVRGRAEWQAGHIPGVENIPVGYIADELENLPRDGKIVLHCQGGGRSAIAASVLRSHGFANVANLAGGYAAWDAAGYPTERGADELVETEPVGS